MERGSIIKGMRYRRRGAGCIKFLPRGRALNHPWYSPRETPCEQEWQGEILLSKGAGYLGVTSHEQWSLPITTDPEAAALKAPRCKWEPYRDKNEWYVFHFYPARDMFCRNAFVTHVRAISWWFSKVKHSGRHVTLLELPCWAAKGQKQ